MSWLNPSSASSSAGHKSGASGHNSAKVKDRDELIASALKETASDHSLARVALQVILDEGGQKAREAAVLYSRPGQPSLLRQAAIQALILG